MIEDFISKSVAFANLLIRSGKMSLIFQTTFRLNGWPTKVWTGLGGRLRRDELDQSP